MNWLIEEIGVILDNGEPVKCFRLDYDDNDEILDSWAIHIRRHYISDRELKESCDDLEMPVAEYLKEFVIPQKGDNKLVGAARSNGISEILFSDLFEFVYGLEVPRCRFDNMSGKTLSEHGTDIIAYRFYNKDKTPSVNDRLVTVEVKAGLTQNSTEVIEKAVVDANKDEFRFAQSLDYMRKKLIRMNKEEQAKDVVRFLKKTKVDYVLEKCAAGISSIDEMPESERDGIKTRIIPGIVGDELRIKGDASIYFVHGKRLMDLANNIYNRCLN